MCLIVLAWRLRPDLPLIVAANRDEFHARPAAPAAFWDDQPGILAGRDLEARGTWMGVSRTGRFAAVTNFRGGREPRAIESRGALVSRFLSDGEAPEAYVRGLKKDLYSGFNLLVADGQELWSVSNRGGEAQRLEPGIYGLGNTLLDALTMAYKAIDQGAAGVDMGRNIFQSDDPVAMIQAVGAVVHKKEKPEKALQLYQQIKARNVPDRSRLARSS